MTKLGESTLPPVDNVRHLQAVLADEQQKVEALKQENKRMKKSIQAEHRYKASIGGGPCECEYCKELG